MTRRRGPGRDTNTSSQSGPYPWSLWFQQAQMGPVTLRRGVDFGSRVDTFQQQIRNQARRLGLKVGTRVGCGEDGGSGDGEGTVTFWVRAN